MFSVLPASEEIIKVMKKDDNQVRFCCLVTSLFFIRLSKLLLNVFLAITG